MDYRRRQAPERRRTLVLGPRAEQCPVIGEFREALERALDGLQVSELRALLEADKAMDLAVK